MTKQKSHVIFNTAASLDGRIEGKEEFFANRQEKYRISRLRGSVDAIMVDVETVRKFDPLLEAHELSEEEPWRIVIDNKCDIKHDAKILGYEKVIVVASGDVSEAKVKALVGVEWSAERQAAFDMIADDLVKLDARRRRADTSFTLFLLGWVAFSWFAGGLTGGTR